MFSILGMHLIIGMKSDRNTLTISCRSTKSICSISTSYYDWSDKYDASNFCTDIGGSVTFDDAISYFKICTVKDKQTKESCQNACDVELKPVTKNYCTNPDLNEIQCIKIKGDWNLNSIKNDYWDSWHYWYSYNSER
jgi:hypothetical protein